jgi:tetratricopeptide (TPR) repeat protein
VVISLYFTPNVKDSTALIRDLDPEAAQQLLDPTIQRMMDAVHRFEGTANQVLGDGIKALFSAPIAHEDYALEAAYTLGERVTDAVPLLTQALEHTMATDMRGLQALCSLPLAEAQMLAGRLEEAHVLAERALALTRAHQERGNEAYALRLLGDIAARREPPQCEQAAEYYRQAIALAEALGMRPLLAHCHRGLGTLYATTGQTEQAGVVLSTAIEMYRAMDMTFWLSQAEAALVQRQ